MSHSVLDGRLVEAVRDAYTIGYNIIKVARLCLSPHCACTCTPDFKIGIA